MIAFVRGLFRMIHNALVIVALIQAVFTLVRLMSELAGWMLKKLSLTKK